MGSILLFLIYQLCVYTYGDTIFSDTFGSNCYTNWNHNGVADINVYCHSHAPCSSLCFEFWDGKYIETKSGVASTIGYKDIILQFTISTKGLTLGDTCSAEYYNGQSWIPIASYGSETNNVLRTGQAYVLGPDADDNSNLKIQFDLSPNALECFIDDVYLMGTPITSSPTPAPTPVPTIQPTTSQPTKPTIQPTTQPTSQPTSQPTAQPTLIPSLQPTSQPTSVPTTAQPTATPTANPTIQPTSNPTSQPTSVPSESPTNIPTKIPTNVPSQNPTNIPTETPTTAVPTLMPTFNPSDIPSKIPTAIPTEATITPIIEQSVIETTDHEGQVDETVVSKSGYNGENESKESDTSSDALLFGLNLYIIICIIAVIVCYCIVFIFCVIRYKRKRNYTSTIASTIDGNIIPMEKVRSMSDGIDDIFAAHVAITSTEMIIPPKPQVQPQPKIDTPMIPVTPMTPDAPLNAPIGLQVDNNYMNNAYGEEDDVSDDNDKDEELYDDLDDNGDDLEDLYVKKERQQTQGYDDTDSNSLGENKTPGGNNEPI